VDNSGIDYGAYFYPAQAKSILSVIKC